MSSTERDEEARSKKMAFYISLLCFENSSESHSLITIMDEVLDT